MSRHIARKRFGQNFLIDHKVIFDIVQAVAPHPGQTVIEIGPGLGALTKPLSERLDTLHVIEIDRDIIAHLRSCKYADKLVIHEGDVLQFDFSKLAGPKKILGNLPYNISTPLLFHLASYADHVIDMHFMLQKEVVDRMVAQPDTADYGRLSVMLQYFFEMEELFEVPGSAFSPAPKVASAIVRMIPSPGRIGQAHNLEQLRKLVSAAFAQRRKTIRNTLKGIASDGQLRHCGIDPDARAENIPAPAYVRLANDLFECGAVQS